jgi:proteasome lid subunit RPN8/RPN11
VTDSVDVPDEIAEAILWHASACFPLEACGLVAVDSDGALCMAYPLTNEREATDGFTISPTEHFGAVRHAERNGWEIGAVFHSHPNGEAAPSPTDLAQPHDPDWIHLIVGFHPARNLQAWRITDGRPLALAVVRTRGRPVA